MRRLGGRALELGIDLEGNRTEFAWQEIFTYSALSSLTLLITFSVYDLRSPFLVLFPQDPAGLESMQRGQNGASDPH